MSLAPSIALAILLEFFLMYLAVAGDTTSFTKLGAFPPYLKALTIANLFCSHNKQILFRFYRTTDL
jgi:hypothetical protein